MDRAEKRRNRQPRKKLREAREDGKVAKSKELTAAFDLIVMFLMLKIFVSTIGDGFLQIFYYVYNLIPDFIGINAMDVSTYAVMSFFFTGEYTDAQNRGTVFYFRIRRDATCKYSAGGVEGFHETDAAKAGPV